MSGGDRVKQKMFIINTILVNVPILYPPKTPENLGFLVFSGGINGNKWDYINGRASQR